jgi:hypothetical protein
MTLCGVEMVSLNTYPEIEPKASVQNDSFSVSFGIASES